MFKATCSTLVNRNKWVFLIMSDFIAKLNALAQLSQQKLVNILDSIPGKKDVIIEASIMKPLERFIGVSKLRAHGVDKIYKLEKTGPQHINNSVVYIVRSTLITGKRVCDQIRARLNDKTHTTKYHIVFVPKVLVAVESLYEEEGLVGRVTFHALSWELIQLDSKILSFECPEIFKDLFIASDTSLLTSIVRSIWSFKHVFGKPPVTLFHGQFSTLIGSMLETWDAEMGSPDKPDSDFGCLLVLDRDIDYASALMVPGTYTSLAADVLGVATGVIEVKAADLSKNEAAITMLLTSEDEIYNQIKTRHFSDVFNYLKNKASDLNTEMGKRSYMGIKEMREFVKNDLSKTAGVNKALANHINVCERVTNDIGQKFESLQISQENILEGVSRREVITHIEDIMATATDMHLALRLIALLSLVQNGFSYEESNIIKMQFLHAYGHDHLITFNNLEKLGLFYTHPSIMPTSIAETGRLASKMAQVVSLPKKTPFQITSNKLKLLRDTTKEYNLKEPQDSAYVFGGAYVPLVAQLVYYLITKEMSLGELSKCISVRTEPQWVGKSLDSVLDVTPRAIMVYIIGGISYAEIAALNLVERKTGCRIVCAGTHIITAQKLLDSASLI